MTKLLGEIWYRLSKWLMGWVNWKPHFVAGGVERPYLLRWYILPRNPLFNVYLHKFLRDDDDRALHDHPWPSLSILVKGEYIEHTEHDVKHFRTGQIILRGAQYRHRVQLVGGKPCWTLFFTGRTVREWGFWCPRGWVHWKEFLKAGSTGEVGKGCD